MTLTQRKHSEAVTEKIKTRYSLTGFSDVAQLDEGSLRPTAFTVTS
ncbi:MAG: hypothetical protein Q4D79_08330 [Propionibacteriaceae bacterium]|nr:hypothetical protein [Propionibacteriaceae bacterium]